MKFTDPACPLDECYQVEGRECCLAGSRRSSGLPQLLEVWKTRTVWKRTPIYPISQPPDLLSSAVAFEWAGVVVVAVAAAAVAASVGNRWNYRRWRLQQHVDRAVDLLMLETAVAG